MWGCGGSRQFKSVFISKNKAPPVLVQRVGWSSFRHYHYFLLSQPMFENKNRICVWGCGASRQSESISISKNEALPVLVQRVKLWSFRNYHCFNYYRQYLKTKIKFVRGCGARRQCGSISIFKSKGWFMWFMLS